MIKNYKRMIMALVCAVSLMAQAVTAYAAGCDCGCDRNNCTHIEDFKTDNIYSPIGGEMYHKVTWYQINRCTICHVFRETEMTSYESCQWTKYEDLGHQRGEDHKYRLTCGICHGTYDITLTTCSGADTGKHITPW